MNMPDLAEFDPTAAAKMFVDEKCRRKSNITTANEKTRQQVYFKGVFPEARRTRDLDDTDDK